MGEHRHVGCGVANEEVLPIPLDAIAEWLERHPEIDRVIITETVEEWYE